MTFYINGVAFDDDVIAFDASDEYTTDFIPVSESNYPRSTKGPRSGAPLSFTIAIRDNSPDGYTDQVLGLIEQNNWLLLESDSQNIYGSVRAVYFRPAGAFAQQLPGVTTAIDIDVRGEIIGIPVDEGGTATMGRFGGGELPATEWDSYYFSLQDGTRKGATPTETMNRWSWTPRSSNDWTDTRGTWRIKKSSDGYWYLSQTGTGGSDYITTFDSLTNFANGTIQTMIYFTSAETSTSGLQFRLSSTATTATGYMASIKPSDQAVKLYEKTGDNTYTELVSVSATIDLYKWYNLSVVADSTTINVFLNGVLVISQAEATYTTGYVGLRTGTTSTARFRDLLISTKFSPRIHTTHLSSDTQVLSGLNTDVIPTGDNLITNYSFETDVTNWTTNSSSSLLRSTEHYKFGSASMKVTRGSADVSALSNQITVNHNTNYYLSGWVRNHDATNVSLVISWRNSGGSEISTTTTRTIAAKSWCFVEITGRSPITAVSAYVEVSISGSTDDVAYVDGLQLHATIPVIRVPPKIVNYSHSISV